MSDATNPAAAPHDPRLSPEALRQAIDTLDAKIRTLHNRAHTTAAGSDDTYEAHAATLETKRARLAEQLEATRSKINSSQL
jgi:chaperonin cofactor prefoldin